MGGGGRGRGHQAFDADGAAAMCASLKHGISDCAVIGGKERVGLVTDTAGGDLEADQSARA